MAKRLIADATDRSSSVAMLDDLHCCPLASLLTKNYYGLPDGGPGTEWAPKKYPSTRVSSGSSCCSTGAADGYKIAITATAPTSAVIMIARIRRVVSIDDGMRWRIAISLIVKVGFILYDGVEMVVRATLFYPIATLYPHICARPVKVQEKAATSYSYCDDCNNAIDWPWLQVGQMARWNKMTRLASSLTSTLRIAVCRWPETGSGAIAMSQERGD
jgi:hypothetical protein